MTKPLLHIINSAYNPKGNWVIDYIARAREYEQALPDISIKFILVDDGSTQNIDQEIHYIKKELHNFETVTYAANRGKGYAIRKGIAYSKADYYCYTDIDFPYTQNSFRNLFEKISNSNCDVVLGTRTKAYFDAIPLQRRIISQSLIFFNKTFLGLQFPDTQAGIKIINNMASNIFLDVKTPGFLFEVEFLKKAHKILTICSVEVSLRENIHLNSVGLTRLIRLFKEYVSIN
jgi:glycosyltransferase involved in cell wall biosynthesis